VKVFRWASKAAFAAYAHFFVHGFCGILGNRAALAKRLIPSEHKATLSQTTSFFKTICMGFILA
jgi:hypothetical protein